MIAEFGHFALLLILVAGFSQALLFSPIRLTVGRIAAALSFGPKTAAAVSGDAGTGTVSGAGLDADEHPDMAGSPVEAYALPSNMIALPLVILVLGLIAQAALIQSFIASDFSLPIVAGISHSSTPLLFRVGAAFITDGGAMLLWVLATALANTVFALQVFRRSSQPDTSAVVQNQFTANALSILGIVITVLAVVTLVDADPFLREAVAPLDGRGMNPQSQDMLRILREPALYLGLAGLAVIFAVTVSGLAVRKIDRGFAETLRPWVMGAWLLLGLAIAINAYRSYSQQAWGTWWYWDTAENSLLIPWLLATALVHCRAVLEKTETLKSWTAFLGISAFALGWFGVYLTQSDLLSPLPKMLTQSGDSAALLIGFCLLFSAAYFLFWRQSDRMAEQKAFGFVSRESGMFVNSVTLSLMAAVILIGTIYPLVLRWVDGEHITVGAPFYVTTLLPAILPLMFIMGFAPVLRWRQDELWLIGRRMKLAAILSAIIILFVSIRFIELSPLPLIGLGLAGWILTSSVSDLWARLWHQPDHGESKYRNLQLLGPRYISMTLSHIGLAILIAGGSASAVWEEQVVLSARAGQSIQVGPYNLQYEGVSLLAGENYATRQATFILYRNSLPLEELFPEIRYYPIRGTETREADIFHGRDGDVHVSVGDRSEDGGRIVTVRFLPMMPWVWGGMILMLIGGSVSILTRIFLRIRKNGVPAS